LRLHVLIDNKENTLLDYLIALNKHILDLLSDSHLTFPLGIYLSCASREKLVEERYRKDLTNELYIQFTIEGHGVK
jgi:hypothetical protein